MNLLLVYVISWEQQLTADVEPQIKELQLQIKDYEVELDTLFEQKYAIEAESRELEADVGPVKYIAELVYGDEADRDSLEDAVRWVILILVIVFDPLSNCIGYFRYFSC